tara:strand:+ start:3640 stop:4848 length:1209 start_codon:yes stop_codon:yes gene_type:complete
MTNFKLRNYQQEASVQGVDVLKKYKILILNFQVRTGKTHIALDIAKHYSNVLFVTKKKAIGSIEKDYITANHTFNITIINYESLHKVKGNFDLVIADESHSLGAFPKPSKRTKMLRSFVNNDLILMTGTLLPESNSQIFHQLWISPFTPFKQFANFYKFFNVLGVPEIIYTSYGQSKSYKNLPYERISKVIEPMKLTYTQEEAGFSSTISEHVIDIDMLPVSYDLINRLKRDLVLEGNDEVVLADTSVKLMQKVHQLSSGTVKFESGNSKIIDYSKANYIRDNFKGKKLAIFYKFKEELNAIKSVLDITQDVEEFNTTDKHIALQFVSGREGINLSKADCIVAYNIDFSAVTYWQFRDRMTTITREDNDVFWLFSKGGIEYKIHKAVMNKKNYTLQTFKKEL